MREREKEGGTQTKDGRGRLEADRRKKGESGMAGEKWRHEDKKKQKIYIAEVKQYRKWETSKL